MHGKMDRFNLYLQVDKDKNANNLTTKRKEALKKPIALDDIDNLLVACMLNPIIQSKPVDCLHQTYSIMSFMFEIALLKEKTTFGLSTRYVS
jgi:hypothetical protein